MICPKCNSSNSDDYVFCLQCGTALSDVANASSETPTVLFPPDPPLRTEILPSHEVPPTVQYSGPRNTNEQQNSPTRAIQVPPTILYTPDRTAAQIQPADPPSPIAEQDLPSKSVETVATKPKRAGKVFLIAGMFLLLLAIGGGVAVYFFAQPMQADKIYVLTDKRDVKDKVLSFDNQRNTFTVVGAEKDGFQRWQIVPDPGAKSYYRFVNRGLGEGKSLEVVDDNYDTSVNLARTAIDTGQLWAITQVKDDYYRITNQWLGDGKSLAHFKRSYYFLRLRDANNDDRQLWKKVPSGDGKSFYLVNKQYGDNWTLEAYSSGQYQDKLELTATNPLSPDTRWIEKDAGSSTVNLTTARYDLSGPNKLLGANPSKSELTAMAAAATLPGQSWKFIPVGSDYFRLTNGDGKSLEAVTFVEYTLEMVKTADDDPGQLWQLTRTDK